MVPIETLEHSLEQVPISVKKLAPLVRTYINYVLYLRKIFTLVSCILFILTLAQADFFCELDNSVGEVVIKHPTWDEFRDNWSQTCPWIPPNNSREDDKRFHAQLRSTM